MTTEATTRPNGDVMFNSLTGFDEIAIKRQFGVPISALTPSKKHSRDGDPMQFLRALVFVQERREGHGDAAAFSNAQTYTMQEVNDYFPDPPKELDPDNPETAEGKAPAATS